MEMEATKIYSIVRHTVTTFSCPSKAPEVSDTIVEEIAELISKLSVQSFEEGERDSWVAEVVAGSLKLHEKFIMDEKIDEKTFDGPILLDNGYLIRNGKRAQVHVIFDADTGANIYQSGEWVNREEVEKQVIELLLPVARDRVIPLANQLRKERSAQAANKIVALHSGKKDEKPKRRFFGIR